MDIWRSEREIGGMLEYMRNAHVPFAPGVRIGSWQICQSRTKHGLGYELPNVASENIRVR